MEKDNNYGTLYVIATPIGNLKDITFRAIETLKDVDLVLAEDTRKSGILLKQYDIKTPMKSYRDQNHDRVFPEIVQLLQSGKDIGLISDSGTPLISDPGYKLIKELLEFGVTITPIPGPSAAISALSISGLPTDKFSFIGFLPKGSGKRKTLLERYGNLNNTIILYESPFRVLKLLQIILDTLGNRQICITNELTKKFERVWHGNVEALLNELSLQKMKGEFTIVIGKELLK